MKTYLDGTAIGEGLDAAFGFDKFEFHDYTLRVDLGNGLTSNI